MNFKNFFYVIFLSLFFSSCSQKKDRQQQITLSFPNEPEWDASCELNQGKQRILYYLDGNCSYCFGMMKALEEKVKVDFEGVELTFVAFYEDKDIFEWNMSESDISTCLISDLDKSFEKANIDKVYLGQMVLLGENNEVLAEGNIIEDEDKLREFKSFLD